MVRCDAGWKSSYMEINGTLINICIEDPDFNKDDMKTAFIFALVIATIAIIIFIVVCMHEQIKSWKKLETKEDNPV